MRRARGETPGGGGQPLQPLAGLASFRHPHLSKAAAIHCCHSCSNRSRKRRPPTAFFYATRV